MNNRPDLPLQILQLIETNDLAHLQQALTTIQPIEKIISVPVKTYIGRRDYDGYEIDDVDDDDNYDISYEEELIQVETPIYSFNLYGPTLLLAAIERRQVELVEFLLRFEQITYSENDQLIKQKITLTPTFFQEILNLVLANTSSSEVSKKPFGYGLSIDPLTDTINQTIHIPYQTILTALFEKFILDQASNQKIMENMFEKLTTYFPNEKDLQRIVRVCLGETLAKKNEAVFLSLWSHFKEITEALLQNELTLSSQLTPGMKIILHPENELPTQDELKNLNDSLLKKIESLYQKENNRSYTLYKADRVEVLKSLLISAEKTKDMEPLTQLETLLKYIIQACNKITIDIETSRFATQSKTLTQLQTILDETLNHDRLKNIFGVKKNIVRLKTGNKTISCSHLTLEKKILSEIFNMVAEKEEYKRRKAFE